MKVIVTTTINPPTKALKLFAKIEGWTLVIAGDLKTPHSLYKEELPEAVYLSPEDQNSRAPELSETIGWNCIQRRNFGLLWASDHDAELVAVVDDDNIPYPSWGQDLLVGNLTTVSYHKTTLPVWDPVGCTNYPHLWHRGYPLQLLGLRESCAEGYESKIITPDVQADFWNGDPDIDAICRMQFRPECTFSTDHFPMASKTISPFNSQNTILKGSLLSDYFLPPGIGRMDDIWASYYLQAKTGAQVVYGKPSVYQDRNVHNLTKDMEAEFLGYSKNLDFVVALTQNPEKALETFLPEESYKAFLLYKKALYKKISRKTFTCGCTQGQGRVQGPGYLF